MSGSVSEAVAVKLSGLVRRFGDRTALDGVTLTLAAGGTLAVFGPNGAGKSTLLRVLATLLRPHSGDVRVLEHEMPGEGWAVRGRLGYLGHEPLLYRELTARENLRFHARLHAVEAAEERISELLETVGMAHRADERIEEMSRGMVQRIAVCRAILHSPELLLLDEPRSSLDPAAAALVEPLIGPAPGRTRVLVSHDVEGGLAEATRVLVLAPGGRVAHEGEASSADPGGVRAVYAGGPA